MTEYRAWRIVFGAHFNVNATTMLADIYKMIFDSSFDFDSLCFEQIEIVVNAIHYTNSHLQFAEVNLQIFLLDLTCSAFQMNKLIFKVEKPVSVI